MYDSRPASGRAIAALVLGILSLVLCGPFSAVPAWALGWMELRAIRAGAAPPAGRGFALVGMILGIVVTLLSVAVAILIMFGLLPLFWVIQQLPAGP